MAQVCMCACTVCTVLFKHHGDALGCLEAMAVRSGELSHARPSYLELGIA